MAAPDFVGVERATPVLIDGLRDPSGMVSNYVVFDADETLVLIEPTSAPFMTIMGALKKRKPALQYRFDRFEKDPLPRTATVGSAATSGATSLVLTAGHGARINKYSLLRNRTTGEVVWVSAVSTDTLTVTRQIGGTGPADMAVGQVLVVMNEAHEDGARSGDMLSTKESDVHNFCQIFRRKYGFSGRQTQTELVIGGTDVPNERRVQAIEHRKDMEFAAVFGRRHSLTGPGGLLVTMTGGADQFVTSNVWDLNNQEPSENQLVEWLEWAMREGAGGNTFGRGVKWLYACDRLVTIIERFARDRIQYVNPLEANDLAKKLNVGLRVGKFTTTHGTIMIVPTPIFRTVDPTKSLLVDMNHVRYVPHRGRDTKLLKDRQENDADSMQEEWFTDMGFEWTHETAHSWITRIPV